MIGQPASPGVPTRSHCQTADVPNMHCFVIRSRVDMIFKYLCCSEKNIVGSPHNYFMVYVFTVIQLIG